ncbi:MAG: GreA/GreB family elongation factor [Alphaproteobacteria bacterium]|nr:GreA/GreB family elongation factor [Alphaproteobacteria bacterium]
MKIFVTKEYFDKSQRKVRELQERLAQIRSDKTAAYTQDTNTWHDNFAYEHLTREEKQTEKLVADLLADLDNMLVVPRNKPANTGTVGLYCWVCVTQENETTGAKTKCRLGIVPLGAEDIPQQKYAYNMPLVHPLVGLSVGDEITVRVPSGEIHMTIRTIEPLQPQE